MGARPRRRRRAARKLRFRRWLRRQDRFTRVLTAAVVALSLLVAALIALRVNEEPRAGRTAVRTPAPPRAPQPRTMRATAPRAPVQHARRESPASRPSPANLTPPATPAPSSAPSRHAPPERPAPPAPTAATSALRPATDVPQGPRAAIVIDDLGQRLSHLEQLADLNIPLSIAVIPGLPASSRTVSEAARRGIEMLLHQPMEPHEAGGKNPGAGVLLTSMSASAVRALVRANLAAVPGAVGVNNHMGSRFTEDAAALGALMEEIRDHGLFWLDSKTTGKSRGPAAADAAGVPELERDIFLDAEVNAESIRRQVRRLVDAARVHGTAVGIGHPHPETIAVLRELRAELLASGVTLVPVSSLVKKDQAAAARLALAAAPAVKSGASEPAAPRKPETP